MGKVLVISNCAVQYDRANHPNVVTFPSDVTLIDEEELFDEIEDELKQMGDCYDIYGDGQLYDQEAEEFEGCYNWGEGLWPEFQINGEDIVENDPEKPETLLCTKETITKALNAQFDQPVITVWRQGYLSAKTYIRLDRVSEIPED